MGIPDGSRASEAVLLGYATHDLSVAFELADRAIVLKRSIPYDGPVRELVEGEGILRGAILECHRPRG